MSSWGRRIFGGGSKKGHDDDKEQKDKKEQEAHAQHQQQPSLSAFAPPAGPPPGPGFSPPTAPYAPPPGAQPAGLYSPPSGPPPAGLYSTPAGPPPNAMYSPPASAPPTNYAPPGGPPPASFAPPAGPPPSASYAPPPGPPPTYIPPRAPPLQETYAPPPGPPPPPSYDQLESQWSFAAPTAPPAVLSYIASPALNASEDDFEAGEQFVARYPLAPARQLSQQEVHAMDAGQFALVKPPQLDGTLSLGINGTILVRATHARDSTLISNLPLYSAARGAPATVYYEIQIVKMGRDGSIALGMCAVPYPPFRLPGWNRGSIAIHADDGHRYTSDPTGGVEFTEPFVPGDIVGLGLELHTGQVWFTRNGHLAGGFSLREDRKLDMQLDVTVPWQGLDGSRDVYAAVGICGEAQAIVNLGGERTGSAWAWRRAT